VARRRGPPSRRVRAAIFVWRGWRTRRRKPGSMRLGEHPGNDWFWHLADMLSGVGYGRFRSENGLRYVIWRAPKVAGRKEGDEAG
jgi:hypothetical protein